MPGSLVGMTQDIIGHLLLINSLPISFHSSFISLCVLKVKVKLLSCVVSDSLRPHGLQPARLLRPWDFPGKSTRVGCHFLLQRIFPTQASNLGLPHCRQTLYSLNHQGRQYYFLFYFKQILAALCLHSGAWALHCSVWAQQLQHRLSCLEIYTILIPQPGIELASPALEGRFLTTRPPGKFLAFLSFFKIVFILYKIH